LSAIGTDEAQLSLWVSVFDVMLAIRKIRAARSFSLDGRISLPEKVSFFRKVLGQDIGEALPGNLERFLVPLLEGNLWDDIPFLKDRLVTRFDINAGRITVQVNSPEALSPENQAKIVQALETGINSDNGVASGIRDLYAKGRSLTVRPVWKIKPSLLAGLEIRIKSTVWDASLAARLRELERQLLATA
jgi:F0F1-type ATP synthase delta subunit